MSHTCLRLARLTFSCLIFLGCTKLEDPNQWFGAANVGDSSGSGYLLPAALAVMGLGAIATGIVFNVKREQAAHEWNGPRCENPGFTRQQQCQSVDSRIQSDEHLAVGLYAGGGALLAGSIISLLAGRVTPAPTERASACTVVGTGVSCLGHF